jgi:hypothetical protein
VLGLEDRSSLQLRERQHGTTNGRKRMGRRRGRRRRRRRRRTRGDQKI